MSWEFARDGRLESVVTASSRDHTGREAGLSSLLGPVIGGHPPRRGSGCRRRSTRDGEDLVVNPFPIKGQLTTGDRTVEKSNHLNGAMP